MKKRIFVLVLAGLLSFSSLVAYSPMIVRAEPDATQEVADNIIDEDEAAEGEIVEGEVAEEGEVVEGEPPTEEVIEESTADISDTAQVSEIGDELVYILNTDTKKSDETPCQVTAKFTIPSGFNLNTYMDIMHDDGTVYRTLTSDANSYSDFAFVKEGHYIVLAYGVVNDAANRYKFNVEQDDFTVDATENSVTTIKLMIENYDEIAQIISDRTGEEKQTLPVTEEIPVEDNFMDRFPTNMDGVTIGADGTLYYETVSNSKNCVAQVYGNATGTYDLYFEVIKPGVLGEAEFNISLDGGKTFIGTDISANDYSFASRGLYITFTTENDTDELEVGDTFTASVPETFAVSSSYYTQKPNIIVSGHPENDYLVMVTILSTGNRGVAKYSLSLDNGVSTEYIDTIPEDGVVTYGELTYYFSDATFSKGVTYSSKVESNITEVSFLPLYIMCGILGVVCIGVYIWLSLQREKPINYRIRVWEDRQDAEKYK